MKTSASGLPCESTGDQSHVAMSSHRQIEPRQHDLVMRMFVATADQNYILARFAALSAFHLDFFWMGLHAVEKYLKAILLLNGRRAIAYRHNIQKLSDAALTLHPSLSWDELKKPSDGAKHWGDETVASFIGRLNRHGDPHNRYLTYGFYFERDDLFKLDQLVWSLRRHCRPLLQRQKSIGKIIDIDWVEQLRQNPREWRINPAFPLESALDGKKRSPILTDAARHLNQPFAPSNDHDFSDWGFAAVNAPLPAYFQDLIDESKSLERREEAYKVLKWAFKRIDMGCEDRDMIKSALRKHPSGARGEIQ